eukprot:1626450-Prymnesium_polylepis.1
MKERNPAVLTLRTINSAPARQTRAKCPKPHTPADQCTSTGRASHALRSKCEQTAAVRPHTEEAYEWIVGDEREEGVRIPKGAA